MFLRILIVDDSQIIRKLLREELEVRTGWQICGEAQNGQDAIEMARRLGPDLIVLDLSMPVMNGLQAAPILRKLLPSTPIVMFTSHKTDDLQAEALAAGVNTLVEKSNPLAVLVKSIQSQFPKSNELRKSVA